MLSPIQVTLCLVAKKTKRIKKKKTKENPIKEIYQTYISINGKVVPE
jgi:hypothetical protein